MPFALWTREAVQTLIQDRYDLALSLSTIGRYLKRWGFTPQKPLRRAYERDLEAVRRWFEEEYPTIRAAAKVENTEIHWGDEMGLRSDHQAGTSYGRRGEAPVIPGTGQRFRCNMISTITNRGQLSFMVFKERFTGEVMISFLCRLVRQQEWKVYVIVDGHPVHRSNKVKRWVSKRAKQVSLPFLTGYSPDLNPDESLNQDVKTNAPGRKRPANREEMIEEIRGYLRSAQRQPVYVQRYFHHDCVNYAAE